MLELIALVVFIGSLIGIVIIVLQKIPVLLELPETSPTPFNWKELLIKIKNLLPLRDFSFEIFLQKILSKIRILTLKTDSKTSNWLQKLRERTQKKKFGENDNYWEKVKKSTKE